VWPLAAETARLAIRAGGGYGRGGSGAATEGAGVRRAGANPYGYDFDRFIYP